MFEPDVGLVFEVKLNFDQFFLQLNIRKKICKELLYKNIVGLTGNTEYQTLLAY